MWDIYCHATQLYLNRCQDAVHRTPSLDRCSRSHMKKTNKELAAATRKSYCWTCPTTKFTSSNWHWARTCAHIHTDDTAGSSQQVKLVRAYLFLLRRFICSMTSPVERSVQMCYSKQPVWLGRVHHDDRFSEEAENISETPASPPQRILATVNRGSAATLVWPFLWTISIPFTIPHYINQPDRLVLSHLRQCKTKTWSAI